LQSSLQFRESRERAKEWYNSTRYQHAKSVRWGAAKVELVLLSGYEP